MFCFEIFQNKNIVNKISCFWVKEFRFVFQLRSFHKPHIGVIIDRKEGVNYKESDVVYSYLCRSTYGLVCVCWLRLIAEHAQTQRDTHECWYPRQIDISTVHTDGIALSLFSRNEVKAEHPKLWWSPHCALICMHGRDVCKYCSTVFERYLFACSHSVYLHQCILISFFDSYCSCQTVPTVCLGSNEQGDNHSVCEGQELQPVKCKTVN